MNRADGIDCYQKALRQGQRDYREKMNAGQSPFLPVLDDILQNVPVENQIPLGQVEIPLELLVGTKTSGRTAAFASNFMPLLGLKTEFATKWINLCVSHLDEGIRDPITCYEYMGRFYVQEGNKRVSVLKYFDASSITGNVTRVVPQYSDDPAVQMYYEFMHFYPVMQNYLLTFTKPGSYARLQKILGKAPDEKWTGEDRTEVLSLYNWVKKAFLAHGGARLQCTVGDVLLLLLRVYTKEELANLSPSELSEKLDALWDDVLALQKSDPVQVSDKPAAPKQTGLLDFILPGKHTAPSHLKVAFVHERAPGTSSWTSQHEFGRTQLDTVFEGKVETAAYFNAVPGKNADALVEQAITDGADVVFTTSPKLVGASLRAAVRHPQVHILNCSMEMPYASIRTYYTRVYEAKFITGAIAGAMAGAAGALYYLSGNTEFFWTTYQSLPSEGFDGIAVALLAVNNPIGVIFTGIFMSLLSIAGLQLTNLTAYNEYITDVIIAVIVYLSAFSLVIKLWISRRKKEGKSILPWKKKQPEGAGLLPDAQPAEEAAAAAEDAGGAAEPEGEAAGTAETGKEAEA